MKKLYIICSLVMVFTIGTAHAQQYEVAPCGTKDFTTTAGITPGGIICLDIWLTGANAPQNAGGAWLDFSDSVADIDYVSGGRCLSDGSEGCIGPWDPATGVFLNEPAGPGTLMYVVGNLGGAAPDGDGDLIVGTVTLKNTGSNDATINITCIPPFCSWTPIAGSDVVPGSIVISQNTDPDEDGIPHLDDNCPTTPNPLQEDTYPPQGNGIGDACDCECDFDCSGGVDANDVTAFLTDFGRSQFNRPCTNADPCNGDVDCNGSSDANDVSSFLEDFGRSQYNNPCPACVAGAWCGGGNICQSNDDCSFFYTFCDKPTGQCDGEGICNPIPSSCPFMPDPVCGCDGNTYINSCTARWWRQSIDYWGACVE